MSLDVDTRLQEVGRRRRVPKGQADFELRRGSVGSKLVSNGSGRTADTREGARDNGGAKFTDNKGGRGGGDGHDLVKPATQVVTRGVQNVTGTEMIRGDNGRFGRRSSSLGRTRDTTGLFERGRKRETIEQRDSEHGGGGRWVRRILRPHIFAQIVLEGAAAAKSLVRQASSGIKREHHLSLFAPSADVDAVLHMAIIHLLTAHPSRALFFSPPIFLA